MDEVLLTKIPANNAASLTEALSIPFPANEVKFKPQSVKNNRALALAYIDCRMIQDRLDQVLGVENWMDDYEILPDGSVMCRLKLKLGDQWVTKMDVGSPSEQPDSGDRLKAAFSDALKRAAVKFGIGRYLYRLPAMWTDYDPVKRQFLKLPVLPAWAIPQPQSVPQREIKAEDRSVGNTEKISALPDSGLELHRRLQSYDAKLAAQELCPAGSLLQHVSRAGENAGFGQDITRWQGPAIQFAVNVVKTFQAQFRHTETSTQQAA